jgi:hypothetical protein
MPQQDPHFVQTVLLDTSISIVIRQHNAQHAQQGDTLSRIQLHAKRARPDNTRQQLQHIASTVQEGMQTRIATHLRSVQCALMAVTLCQVGHHVLCV